MKKVLKNLVKNHLNRKTSEEPENFERSWPVEVFYGSDYDYSWEYTE